MALRVVHRSGVADLLFPPWRPILMADYRRQCTPSILPHVYKLPTRQRFLCCKGVIRTLTFRDMKVKAPCCDVSHLSPAHTFIVIDYPLTAKTDKLLTAGVVWFLGLTNTRARIQINIEIQSIKSRVKSSRHCSCGLVSLCTLMSLVGMSSFHPSECPTKAQKLLRSPQALYKQTAAMAFIVCEPSVAPINSLLCFVSPCSPVRRCCSWTSSTTTARL